MKLPTFKNGKLSRENLDRAPSEKLADVVGLAQWPAGGQGLATEMGCTAATPYRPQTASRHPAPSAAFRAQEHPVLCICLHLGPGMDWGKSLQDSVQSPPLHPQTWARPFLYGDGRWGRDTLGGGE